MRRRNWRRAPPAARTRSPFHAPVDCSEPAEFSKRADVRTAYCVAEAVALRRIADEDEDGVCSLARSRCNKRCCTAVVLSRAGTPIDKEGRCHGRLSPLRPLAAMELARSRRGAWSIRPKPIPAKIATARRRQQSHHRRSIAPRNPEQEDH